MALSRTESATIVAQLTKALKKINAVVNGNQDSSFDSIAKELEGLSRELTNSTGATADIAIDDFDIYSTLEIARATKEVKAINAAVNNGFGIHETVEKALNTLAAIIEELKEA